MSTDEPFVLDWEERDVVRHILREVERRGYDDVRLDPVVSNLYRRLVARWRDEREREPVSR